MEPVSDEIELPQTPCNGKGLPVLLAHEKQVAAVIVRKCRDLRQPMDQNRCEMVTFRRSSKWSSKLCWFPRLAAVHPKPVRRLILHLIRSNFLRLSRLIDGESLRLRYVACTLGVRVTSFSEKPNDVVLLNAFKLAKPNFGKGKISCFPPHTTNVLAHHHDEDTFSAAVKRPPCWSI